MQEGLKLKSTQGEIVAVQGGRILRAIGRKDRHSKVCTAKGPRDRRVRLSATTAIQFYDVQDRLGCDRPSEAIDWLMKEAKAAIDDLGELPSIIPSDNQQPEQNLEEQPEAEFLNSGHGIQSQEHLTEDPINSFSFILPSSSTEFVNSRTRSQSQSQSQDFCLSLQSSQDQMLLQHHLTAISSSEPALFSASTSLNFDATPTNWSNPPTMEIGRSRRMIGEGRQGFVIDSFPTWQQKVLGQDQFFSQGGTLQSSYSPSFRAPMNPPLSDLNYDQMPAVSPSSGTGNLFSGDGFSGFCASPRIQGEEEKHNPAPNKPSSASYPQHYQD